MSLFDDELKLAARNMLDSLGDTVFINGRALQGIINDDQFMDETGIRRETSVSFAVEDAKYLIVNDTIIFDDVHYLIRQLPEPNKEDPFYTVEVKLA